MSSLKKLHPEYESNINESIFWIFWCGLYKTPEDISDMNKHLPVYVMLVLLILEKIA